MRVFVVIEWTGNSTVVDGAVIHGVFVSLQAAKACKASFARGARGSLEIQGHELR